MRFTTILSLCGVFGATASASCIDDNCLRAVVASGIPSRHGTADCSSYFMDTIQTGTSAITVTVTTTLGVHERRNNGRAPRAHPNLEGRQMTITPSAIPTYASACSGSVRYSSACSCIGVTHVTTIIATPVPTSTATVVTTTTCYTSTTIEYPPCTIATPTCTVGTENCNPRYWAIYYAGQGVTENIDNPANDGNLPPETVDFPGTLTTCDAIAQCGQVAQDYYGVAYSYDIHLLENEQTWECTVYYDGIDNSTYFNVANCSVSQVYGFWVPDNEPPL